MYEYCILALSDRSKERCNLYPSITLIFWKMPEQLHGSTYYTLGYYLNFSEIL